MKRFLKNPLLSGFYPDPSICRRGEDYYIVTSTFEYFPGIPVFHSRDFVHWHQIGNVLKRKDQLDLEGLNSSRGIYASSIFYHENSGLFYVITTRVGNAPYRENVNFLVWARDPAGPWSDPVVIQGAEGIDPSLVFDGDRTYYLGNCRPDPDQISGERHIWLQEMDLNTGRLIGERHVLRTSGAVEGASTPEGPHIYHIGEWYYLLTAEGGTSHNHACTIYRSRNLTGPYECNPRNPVLTHRNLRRDYPIHSTGHADLIQLHNGEWWAILLASRPDGGDYRNLGRETFAVPVAWEEEWPVFSPDTGHVEFTYPAPELAETRWQESPVCEQFESETLPPEWLTVRTPTEASYSLKERPGYLRLFLSPSTIRETKACAFWGRRQQHFCYAVRTRMEFQPQLQGEESGIVLRMNEGFHIRLLYGIDQDGPCIRLIRCFEGEDTVLARIPWTQELTYLKVSAHYQNLSFYCASRAEEWRMLMENVDGRLLSKEIAGGFTGTVIGLYATSNGGKTENFSDFDWFEYQGLEEPGESNH